MYDVDLFDVPQATIDQLHADGRVVICHFEAGTWEDWRSDSAAFPAVVLGSNVDGWSGHRWLDVRELATLVPLMGARMDLAVSKGCEGVAPASVDGYVQNTGFPLTSSHQLAYNSALASEAHARSLSVGLVNDIEQVATLQPEFDWALNEACFQAGDCSSLTAFVTAGKAVFGVEYSGDRAVYCPQAVALGFSWLTKSLNLGDEPPNACVAAPAPGLDSPGLIAVVLLLLATGSGWLSIRYRPRSASAPG